MKYLLFTVALFLGVQGASAQAMQGGLVVRNVPGHVTTREQYIERFKAIAVADMEKYGIPASIKMAQGLLESDCGNSRLAVIGNNHFGIKCKSTWKGETISHDDDELQECFRQYDTPEQSWEDHSKFLDEGDRYNFLFELDPLDYKAWAKGLKEAGYATNPRYPEMLVKIIEENELWRLDRGEELAVGVEEGVSSAARAVSEPESPSDSQRPPAEGSGGAEIKAQEKPARRHPVVTPRGGTGAIVDPDNFTVKL